MLYLEWETHLIQTKKLFKRLAQLGAQELVPIALADDQHELGPDAVIDPWLNTFWETILQIIPLPYGKEIISSSNKPIPRYKVTILSDQECSNKVENTDAELINKTLGDNGIHKARSVSKDCPFLSAIIENKKVTTPDHFQDVRLITFDIASSGMSYSPGDVLMIQPSNLSEIANEFINFLGLNPHEKVLLSQNYQDIPLPKHLPQPCTVRYLVENYWDIQGVPRRYFFELLSHLTTSELEEEKLQEFNTAEGQEELYSYCYRPRRTALEVFQDFPYASKNITLEYLFDLITPLKPRAFSIASSIKVHPNQVQILMAVVKYKTNLFKPRVGVCSTWLASLDHTTNVKIPVWIKKATISFPKLLDTPVIMIGPGTGCAPFRSFIEERKCHSNQDGKCVLFFGSRSKCKDFFFEEEWLPLQNNGRLILFTAFSRDQENKIYVQDRLKENSSFVWELIDRQQAWCFLAGNSKQMPSDVSDVLKETFMSEGKLTKDEAEEYLKQLIRTKRYQRETWA
ncbi:NADPH-dependent diflavin oxidoreductase 1-like isoform X2 [Dendronephthya gigantea]|uniref:NADPH-dependent diflavin oxidoreductase 1-like isoform X2 n=1 Tax=Dendronephthya gigantea TaxID=151771 RepID=UPI00106AB9DA|nr:NADPH-dependent diflavin oxidoreductase 1-like isoform X2 [Dendronephthya gigantea]